MAAASSPPSIPIPTQMKAIQVVAFNEPYQINTIPVPTIGPHDLLVKVAVAGYCHTDAMVAAGIFPNLPPMTASHEGAGTVAAVGAQVTDFRPGDRVMCGIQLGPCNACADCAGSAHPQYCDRFAGHVGIIGAHGCFADFVRVDSRSSTKLPPQVGFLAAAPLACAGRTVWRAILQAGVVAGEWLVIFGSGGGLGHLGIQFARAKGIKIVGVDARDAGLAVSRESGADVVVDARLGKEAVVAAVQEATGGLGAHAAVVVSDAPDAAGWAAAATRMHGTLVQIAQPQTVVIPFRELIFRDIRVRGSLGCSPAESAEMVRFIAEHNGGGGKGGAIRVETVRFEGLERIGELMELVESGGLRGKAVVVVDPVQVEADGGR
ncbi:GroES-like protein [Hypoxylon fragiforme]|uniref:GroES-like protein n=1 Tax=Hypoxylon fragiforme TaxID=63214 RepID=UPI0020C69E81|nr:GroES-like protein [Hypoxylon fragiforme]KAI2611297.1 GroES-like protein [Hypoxylon fragiforme]